MEDRDKLSRDTDVISELEDEEKVEAEFGQKSEQSKDSEPGSRKSDTSGSSGMTGSESEH